MSKRLVLIEAGPTPWDLEERLVGNASLPLMAEAMDAIGHLLGTLSEPIEAVYRPAANEACRQAAQIIAKKYTLRPRDNPDLQPVGLGLWQGLLPRDVRQRFPTIYPKWEQQPLLVTPPDGEPLEAAIRRVGDAVNRILRRSSNHCIALVLRPMAFQIASGVLRREPAAKIAQRLRHRQPMETIDVNSD
jgi:broad specificity phosphatase PhoE